MIKYSSMEKGHPNPLHKALAIAYLLLYTTDSGQAATYGNGSGGKWKLLLNNTGVVAMHMALTHYNTVIMFDQTGTGPSRLRLRKRYDGSHCRLTRNDMLDSSCYAYSVEYDITSNKIRPLDLRSDTLSSSGSILGNGTMIQMGGFGPGSRRIRYFNPCGNARCDWREGRKHLSDERWYASNLRLPERDDRVIVVGGRNVFSYEFVPKRRPEEKSFTLPFLHKTYDGNEGGNNLYPIVHLSSDGHLFIFANRESILFNYKRNRVLKTFPRIHGRGSRSHPSTASSVILPLDYESGYRKTEVMICGGAAPGAVSAAKGGRFLKGMSTCGRMVITGDNHMWKMEKMPGPRIMSDMIILPNGQILIINGVKYGCAGQNLGANPALEPYLYKPKKPFGQRFSTLKSTKIARMYRSSAILLPDGRVLVAGSNPNHNYRFKKVVYATELRLQAFTPQEMGREFDERRAHNVTVQRSEAVVYGEEFVMEFLLARRAVHTVRQVVFTAYATPFTTHSMSMNQRMLRLKCRRIERSQDGWWRAVVEAPPSAKVAPSGYYMISVVNDGIPSRAEWVRFVHR